MMEAMDRAVHVIYSALSELNLQLPRSEQIEQSANTVLFGAGGKLDSLALANFIVIAEQKLEESFGFQIDLTQDDPFSPETGHFRTVQSLVGYVSDLAQQRPPNEVVPASFWSARLTRKSGPRNRTVSWGRLRSARHWA
jgi:acyl carrier protein